MMEQYRFERRQNHGQLGLNVSSSSSSSSSSSAVQLFPPEKKDNEGSTEMNEMKEENEIKYIQGVQGAGKGDEEDVEEDANNQEEGVKTGKSQGQEEDGEGKVVEREGNKERDDQQETLRKEEEQRRQQKREKELEKHPLRLEDLADAMVAVWKDQGTRSAVDERARFQVLDSTEYLMSKVRSIFSPDYIPNTLDVLKVRSSAV